MSSDKVIPIVPAPPPVNSLRLVGVLGLIAAVSGLLIVTVYQATLPTIVEHKRLALEQSVLSVIPGATVVTTYVVENGALLPATGDANPNALHVYLGYDTGGDLKGVASEGSARGYADAVKTLYGFDPDCQCINRFTVVSSRETPGFGDKLTTDPAFLANFNALDARANHAQNALANPIVTVKHGTKSKPWQIDAISGATISSRAVGKGLNDSAQKMVPALLARVGELRRRSEQ